MRKNFNTFKPFRHLRNFLALCLVMVMTVGLSWGQTTVTEAVSLSSGTFSSDQITWTCANGSITIQQSKGSSSTAVNSNYISAPRIYKGHVLSFIGSETCKIKKIEITVNSTYYGNSMTAGTVLSGNTVTDNTTDIVRTWGTTSGCTHVISSTNEDGLPAIYIQNVASQTNTQLRFTALSITYIISGSQPTTYTVTYDCNGGTSECPDNVSNITAGTSVTLASAPSKTDYTFDGWSDGTTTYDAGDSYTVNGDITMTAQWTENADPSGITATLVIEDYADANNWTNGTQYTSAVVQPITFTASGGGNTGKYYTSGEEWRYYQSENASITISVPDGYTLVSVTPAYNVTNTGVLKNGNNTIASGSTVAVSGTSVTFTVGNSGTATNGQVKFTRIGVTYEPLTPPAVATPTFNPASGAEFGNEGLQVTISCETTSASIYYTLDGSTPNNNSTLYSGAISLTGTTTIKAIAYDGSESSAVATATYTYIDPNAPGTQNNPYTVAQARTAIDANTGVSDVYAKGVVSAIPTVWSSQYNNITFNFVDENGDVDFLQAFRCASSSTADASDVQIGDTVVVYGNLTKYNSTYEFGQGCQLISLTHPAVPVEAPTFSPAAGTYADAQTVTISCATTGATIYYTTDGTEPTNTSSEYTTPITVSTTATIKAIAYVGTENSVVATATYHINSQANPYTVTEALAFHEYPANGIYVHGIVSTAPSQDPTSNGELSYYISADGTAGTDNQLEVYKGKGLEQAAFTAQNDIQVGDIVTVYGNVQVYNNTVEFGSGNYLVAFERPIIPAEEYTLTVANPANVSFTAVYDQEVLTNGETADIEEGTEITLTVNIADGYILNQVTVVGENSQSVTVTETSTAGVYSFTMPSFNATLNATTSVAPTPSTYTLATSIESGKNYILVGKADGNYYAMGEQRSNNRGAVEITVDGSTATATITNNGAHEFTITSIATAGIYTIQDAATSGYLYAASSSNNHLKTEAALDENHNGEWTITFNAEDSSASIVASSSQNRNIMQFNNSSTLFSCYSSASQHSVYLYVKVETDECTYAVTETNPFIEDFEGSAQLPDCWSSTGESAEKWRIYPTYGYQSSNCVATNKSQDLLLPKLTLPATGATQLSFHSYNLYPEYCTSTEGNSVLISTDNGQTFTTLWAPASYTDRWELVGPISLAPYAGQTVQIKFRITTNDGSEHHYWLLDDVQVEVVASSECAKISAANLPYNEGFENMTTSTEKKTGIMPTCWTLAYEDYAPMADTARPQVFYANGKPASGDYCLFMFGMGILAMPQLADDLDISTLKMSFALRQHKLITQLQVGVMSDLSDETTFTPLATFDNGANTEVQHYVVDFRQYSGNDSPKYIAFRNILAPGHDQQRSVQYIDDISIYVANSADDPDPDHACGIEVPYSQNFDNLTANTTSLTGITPDCWNFIAEADNATAPQVSFGTDNALSGNYSLYMTGRGYLALPEITNAQSLSGLSVSFFVRQKKYAQRLQVGVMTDPDDESTFVKIADIYNNGNYSTPVQHTVSLAAYSGNGKHIAFRNVATNASAVSYNWIDDISVFETPAISCGITVPYEQGFENGIPDCWTFSPDLEGAAAPQISGEYASSGNNSLYMSGMGTFALPEITNVNDLSGLTLTFSVRQRKFAHRIAVGVMTDPSDPNTFVEIERFYNGGVYNMPVEHSVDLGAYSGNGRHIAFRNIVTNSNTVSQQWIDDISIDLTQARSAEVTQGGYETADLESAEEALAPLGVDGFDINTFTVWPNPTTGALTLGMEAQRVEVNSLTGQKVAVFENTSRIDISNLPAGVYILKATLPHGNAVRKIVKR